MNIVTKYSMHAISGTVGFGILFYYGWSSKTAMAFTLLLGIPEITTRIIEGSKIDKQSQERIKVTLSRKLTGVAIIFGFIAFAIALLSIDNQTFKAIIENKYFLGAFWLCFLSSLAADFASNFKNEKKHL